MTKLNSKNIDLIADILLPGNQSGWPSANIVARELNLFIEKMIASDQDIIETLGSNLAAVAPLEQIALMETFEAKESELFGRIYRWLLDAYYSSAAVVARAEALANAAPRETSIHFDERLVDKVIETKAGHYRNVV